MLRKITPYYTAVADHTENLADGAEMWTVLKQNHLQHAMDMVASVAAYVMVDLRFITEKQGVEHGGWMDTNGFIWFCFPVK